MEVKDYALGFVLVASIVSGVAHAQNSNCPDTEAQATAKCQIQQLEPMDCGAGHRSQNCSCKVVHASIMGACGTVSVVGFDSYLGINFQAGQFSFSKSCPTGDQSHASFSSHSMWFADATQCNNGCEVNFKPDAGPSGICGGSTCINTGTATNTGNFCSDDPNPPPPVTGPPNVCDATSGVCMTPTGPQFCANDGAGPCVPANSCGSNSSTTLCASPPNGSPPTPPQPPVPPGQPPQNTTSFTTNTTTSTTTTTTTNTTATYQNPPSTTTQGQCPGGVAPGAGGQCPDGSHAGCPGGSSNTDGTCNGGPVSSGGTTPGACPGGVQPNQSTGKCPGGGAPTCADGSKPNANGQCAAGNGNGPPTTCGGSGTIVNGMCYCPTGTTYDGKNCSNANGDPTQPGNGTCDGPSPPPSCKDVANGGGDCSSPPSCSGDQVMCNIDFQTWSQRCPGKLDQQGDAESLLSSQPHDGTSAFSQSDGSDVAFDDAGFLGGSGACVHFDPVSIDVGGQSVSLDFNGSGWCTLQTSLGLLVLGFAYFRAAQIVMRG